MVTPVSDACVIALDVGGTSVKSGIVHPGGSLLDPITRTPIDSGGDAETILAALAGIVNRHLRRADEANLRVLGVGLGFPGPFDYEKGVSSITGVAKFEGIYGVNVADGLRVRLEDRTLPIHFRNDAEAAIVGEARYGAGKPYLRLIGVTLGTGCGSTFLVDGKPVTHGPGVPEHGWLYPVPYAGQPADDVFSIRGLRARLRAAGVETETIRAAAEQARQGDAAARGVFAAFGRDLAAFLTPFAEPFRADAVLVLGGIANAWSLFGPALGEGLPVRAITGELGPRAPLLGVADLVFFEKP